MTVAHNMLELITTNTEISFKFHSGESLEHTDRIELVLTTNAQLTIQPYKMYVTH